MGRGGGGAAEEVQQRSQGREEAGSISMLN